MQLTETKSIALGRMTYVSPRDQSQYYHRLILIHQVGIISLEDMWNVDKVVYPKYLGVLAVFFVGSYAFTHICRVVLDIIRY